MRNAGSCLIIVLLLCFCQVLHISKHTLLPAFSHRQIIGNLLKNVLPQDTSMYACNPVSLVILREEIKEDSAAGQPPTPSRPASAKAPATVSWHSEQ